MTTHRAARSTLAGLLVATLLSACGGGEAAPVDDPSSEPGGLLVGDPRTIEQFTDPASQLETIEDLTAYLLPGLAGAGADCVAEQLDRDQVLGAEEADGAVMVAETVVGCVDAESFAKIPAMYAVGFEPDASLRYPELEACAVEQLSDSTESVRQSILSAVYVKRLDLYGPPESREVAADKLGLLTSCMDEETETTSAPPPPTPSDPPVNQIPVPWTLVQAGACAQALPSAQSDRIMTVNCETPHRYEVVAATFAAAGGANDYCVEAFRRYTGRALAGSPYTVEILTPAPGAVSAKIVCLARRTDKRPVTGSLAR